VLIILAFARSSRPARYLALALFAVTNLRRTPQGG